MTTQGPTAKMTTAIVYYYAHVTHNHRLHNETKKHRHYQQSNIITKHIVINFGTTEAIYTLILLTSLQ